MPSALVVNVHGEPFARGYAQGRALAPAIRAHIAAVLGSLQRAGIDEPQAYRTRLLAQTTFQDAIQRHIPHLMAEVEGIAAGADLPLAEVFFLQLLDEEWAFRKTSGALPLTDKCSSFALQDPATGVTWIGQNMDLGSYTDGLQRVVRHQGGAGPDALVFTTAGGLGLMGVNAARVGICVNSVPQLPSAHFGIPVAFMLRRLLEARSAAEAADWCRTLPHATNQHYLIADPDHIFSLEACCNGVKACPPLIAGRTFHTNHPLQPGFARYPEENPNSTARLLSVEARLGTGPLTAAATENALSAFDDKDHPVCRLRAKEDGSITFTTGSIITALSHQPAALQSRVSFGPPSLGGFHDIGVEPVAQSA